MLASTWDDDLNSLGIHLIPHKAHQIKYMCPPESGGYISVQQAIDRLGGCSGGLDHGSLSGLADDDHPQYVLADGSRAFYGTVSGVYPTDGAHLATASYVDHSISSHEATYDHSDIAVNTAHRLTVSGNPHNVMATEISDFDIEVANNPVVTENTAARHDRRHEIDSTFDHVGPSGAIDDEIIVFNSNGLPKKSNVQINDVVLNTAHRLQTTGNPHMLDYDDIIDQGIIDLGNFI